MRRSVAGKARAVVNDRRGGVGILFAAGLPMMLGVGMVAVDLGSIQLETRRLQGIADAAAIAGAGDPAHAQSRVDAAIAHARHPHPITATVTRGRFTRDVRIAHGGRFVAGAPTPDAVRVVLSAQSPGFFARAFGLRSVAIARGATAMRADIASFRIGTRLAAIDQGLLNAWLGALTGSQVQLSLMDYRALADTDIDLLAFADALRTNASLQTASFDEVLAARITGAQALEAAGAAIDNPTARAALTTLARAAGKRTATLGTLFAPGVLGAQDGGGKGLVRVDALSLANALLQLASQERQLSLDVASTLPGLGATRLNVAIGERSAQSPWIALAADGATVVRTAQTRVYARTRIAGVSVPGLANVATLDVPVLTELASAEARLGAISCPVGGERAVVLEARPSPGMAAIAQIDEARIDDFTSPMALKPARVLDTLLIDVDALSQIDMGSAEAWQRLHFTGADIEAGTARTVSSSTAVRSLAASLTERVAMQVTVGGLVPVPATPVARAVGGALGGAAPAIDNLLNLATGTLGVRYGQADVHVTGIRCGRPILVA